MTEIPASTRRLLPALVGLVLVTVIVLIVTTLSQSRDTALNSARLDARNLSEVLAAHTANTLQSVDATLQGVAGIWAHMPAAGHADTRTMYKLLREKVGEEKAIRSVYILDTRGRMVHDSAAFPPRALDFSDRDYFRSHGAQPSRLYVSPMMKGRLTGRWGMVLSRPLFDQQGRWGGVVVAALEPRDLERPFGTLNLGANGFITLHHLEGSVVLHVPRAENTTGTTNAELQRLSQPLTPGALRLSTGPLQGAQRIYAMRRLQKYPIVVTVAISTADVLAPWDRNATAYALVAAVFVLSVLLLTWRLMAELRSREALVTALARNDEELRQHRDHLQQAVDTRTEELTRAKVAAEQANLAKSEFLSNMSHELRTPMHVILSFAKLGLELTSAGKAPLETLHQYLSRIRGNGERLLHLLNDLLDLSKLEAARMRYNFKVQHFKQVLTPVLSEIEVLAGPRNQSLVVQPLTEDDLVYCDSVRLQQVMRNLLSNAVKFSPEGSRIELRITAGALPAETTTNDPSLTTAVSTLTLAALEVSVADQGAGIPPEEFETIFDKFIQSSKTKSGAGGTGLGLAISREIVLHHGGQIYAGNRAEGGAVFTVVLPRGPIPGHPLHRNTGAESTA